MYSSLITLYQEMGALSRDNAEQFSTRSTKVVELAQLSYRVWLGLMTDSVSDAGQAIMALTSVRNPGDLLATQQRLAETVQKRATENLNKFMELTAVMVGMLEIPLPEAAPVPRAAAPAPATPQPAVPAMPVTPPRVAAPTTARTAAAKPAAPSRAAAPKVAAPVPAPPPAAAVAAAAPVSAPVVVAPVVEAAPPPPPPPVPSAPPAAPVAAVVEASAPVATASVDSSVTPPAAEEATAPFVQTVAASPPATEPSVVG